MGFDQLNIIVQDMDAAVAFYRRLGFEVADTLPEWQRHHRTVATADGLDVDLDSAEFATMWGGVDRGVVVGIRLPSRREVDEQYEAATAAGGTGLKAPYDAFWGSRYAVVRDPEGTAVGLMSPIDAEHVQPPPAPPG